jgi:tRNA(Ile)-lysidine synthase
MNLQQRVEQRMRSLASPKERILCAVSGGPDSVALANLLRGSFSLIMAHVDHRLRRDSAKDARFVRRLAHNWNLPYHEAALDVTARARQVKRGIEETARDLRYAALVKLAQKTRCSVIATGHHADDQAETVLMNFLRGAGPAGLAGIPPVRELSAGVRLVRPLLGVSRPEILVYLRSHRLSYRRDPSNRSPRFTRNRIRNHLLPLLEKEYPGLKKRLSQMGEILREEQTLWSRNIAREISKTARQNNKRITVDLPRLLGYHKALGRRILRQLLTGISFQDTERVFQWAASPRGTQPLQISGGLQVERKGKELIIHSRGFHE